MAVDDECKLRFLELKAKRTHRFIIYKIDDKKKMVVVEKVGEPTLNYDDFAASLPANECRYAIFDYDFVTEENCQKSKIFFVAWLVLSRMAFWLPGSYEPGFFSDFFKIRK